MNGKRMRRVDRQRRQHREDVVQEIVLEPGALGLASGPAPSTMTMPSSQQVVLEARASAAAGRREHRDARRRSASAARPASGRPARASRRPERTWPRRPATRTMKNSSRLFAEIDRKRSCSSSGWLRLDASSSTRRLNCSQDSSRLMKRCGNRRRAAPSSSMSGGGFGGRLAGRSSTLPTSSASLHGDLCRLRAPFRFADPDFVTVSRRSEFERFHSVSSSSCRSAEDLGRDGPRDRAGPGSGPPGRAPRRPRGAAARERSIRSAMYSTTVVSTTSWRSTNSFTRTARRSASSGLPSATAGASRRRERRSGVARPQPSGGVARGQSTKARRFAGEVEEVEQRGLVALRPVDVLDRRARRPRPGAAPCPAQPRGVDGPGAGAGRPDRGEVALAAARRADAAAATVSGQSGQRSTRP